MMNSASDYTICNLDSHTYTTGYGGPSTTSITTSGNSRCLDTRGTVLTGAGLEQTLGVCGVYRNENTRNNLLVENTRNSLLVDSSTGLYGMPPGVCVSSSAPGLNAGPVSSMNGRSSRSSDQQQQQHLVEDRVQNSVQNSSAPPSLYGGPMSPVSYPLQPVVSTCAATTPPGYEYYDGHTGSTAGLCTTGAYPYGENDTSEYNGYPTSNNGVLPASIGNPSPPLLPQHLQQINAPHLANHLHPTMTHHLGGAHHQTPGCGLPNTNSTQENGISPSSHPSHHQNNTNSTNDNGVATYKWMTVKRGNTKTSKSK